MCSYFRCCRLLPLLLLLFSLLLLLSSLLLPLFLLLPLSLLLLLILLRLPPSISLQKSMLKLTNLSKLHQLLQLHATRKSTVDRVIIRHNDAAMRRLCVPNPLPLRPQRLRSLVLIPLLSLTLSNLYLHPSHHNPLNLVGKSNCHVLVIAHHQFHPYEFPSQRYQPITQLFCIPRASPRIFPYTRP